MPMGLKINGTCPLSQGKRHFLPFLRCNSLSKMTVGTLKRLVLVTSECLNLDYEKIIVRVTMGLLYHRVKLGPTEYFYKQHELYI